MENPTQYHVKQKQRMQLRKYVDELTQIQRSSLSLSQNSMPPSQATSLPLHHPSSQTNLPPPVNNSMLPSNTTSLPLCHYSNMPLSQTGFAPQSSTPLSSHNTNHHMQPAGNHMIATPSPSPDVAMSPGLSSVATSNSEVYI